ncbi:hypothetical protein KI688_007714 [Linnemannia hyalina]|uniref:Ubiquitin-like domain-containing protein n=1 Tax=Linnemannia hyalina TaxID=64524 RepID=A0A9P7XGV1_9FUNG|nr:hypothetical protein KI688_007714 [Linnemannia hyalina]
MSDTKGCQALLDEAAAHNVSGHATTSQNALEDSTAKNKRRVMSRLDVLLAHEHGMTVTIPCKESDTIETVLKWIRNKLGINLDDLYQDDLYVDGRLIRSKDQTIGDSRIFGHVLTYHHHIKNPSVIYIRMPSGKVLEVICGLDMQAEDFKYAIEERTGSSHDSVRLVYKGEQLGGKITLAEYGIHLGSTIVLLFRQGGRQFADNRITFNTILDAPGAHPGELTPTWGPFDCKGIYVEYRCPCSPEKVHVYPGSDLFELSKFSSYCGQCNQRDSATFVGVGFVECQYRFFGIRNTGEQVSWGWKSTEGNRYARLDRGEMLTGWRRLIFESAKMHEVDNCSICLVELNKLAVLRIEKGETEILQRPKARKVSLA